VATPRRIVSAITLALVVVGSVAACAPVRSAIAAPTPSGAPTSSSSSTAPSAFDRTAFSIDDPTSYWVVVNKLRPLSPISYAPKDLVTVPVAHDNPAVMRKDASAALVQMFAAGAAEGAGEMQVQSSYRSYPVQTKVYDGWVSSLGQTQADRQSARPGYSEHQTGLAVDISTLPLTCSLAACFGATPQGVWLAANAYRFGYLLRYPADKAAVTGYEYEPWHFRYIGVPLATELHKESVETLEEFFGLSAAPDYAH
jgi:D-alanyl-D-alanine carboxypeptidase